MSTLRFAVLLSVLPVLVALPAPAAEEDAPSGTTASFTVAGQAIDDPRESSEFQEYRAVPNGIFLESLTFGLDRDTGMLRLETSHLGEEDQRAVVTWWQPGRLKIRLGYDQTPHWLSNTGRTLYDTRGGNLVLPDPMQEDLQFRFVGLEDPQDPANDEPAISQDVRGFADASRPVELRYRRDTVFGDVGWAITDHLTGHLSFSQEQRNGTRPLSLATYFTVGADITEFAAPVDFSTRNASVSLEWAARNWNAAAEVFVSDFTNNVTATDGGLTFGDALVVDNPLRITDNTTAPRPPAVDPFPETIPGFTNNNRAASRFLFAAAPDNEAMWLNLSGGFRVADWARVVAQFSIGENRQDSRFLPFSLNTRTPTQTADLPPMPLEVREDSLTGRAVTDYDGQVDLQLSNVRFTGDPLPWLGFEVFTRSYDYDNRTPEYVVTDYVRGDVDLEGIARAALPFAWKKDNLGAEVSFRLPGEVDLGLGVEKEDWERRHRFAPETSEDILRASVDWGALDWLTLHAAFRTGERTFDHYDEHEVAEESYPEGEPVVNAIVEGLHLFDMAERDQDRLDLMAQVTPVESVTLALQWTALQNDYDTELGRTEDESTGWAIDAAWQVGETSTLTVSYGRDEFSYDLDSRYRPVASNPPSPPAPFPGPQTAIDHPVNDWFSDIDDETDTIGIEYDTALVADRWFLNVAAWRSDSTGHIGFASVPGEVCRFAADGTLEFCNTAVGDTSFFPDVEEDLTSLTAGVRWVLRRNLTLGLGYLYEKFERGDWARDIMRPWVGDVDPGAGESLYLGMRVPDYSVNLFRAALTYTF